MCENHKLKSSSAKQAVAILSVDNIKLDEVGLDLLRRIEQGLISYEEARAEVRSQAKAFAENSNKMK